MPNTKFVALVDRAQKIILAPQAEWEKIDGETTTVQNLYLDYAVILAAIPAVCEFLHSVLFGHSAFGVTVRPSFLGALSNMVIGYVLNLLGVCIAALAIDFMAPNFGGKKNQIQSFKVAVYSGTAAWLSGIFMLIPGLSFLAIVGLYSLYLLYCGLPKLMKTTEDKALPYTALVVVITLVFSGVSYFLTAPLRPGTTTTHVSGELSLPGGQKINVAEMQKHMELAQQTSQTAQNVQPISSEVLKGLMPDNTPNGFTRSEIEVNSGGAEGQKVTAAKATYTHGQSRVDVSVVDMAGAPNLGGMMALFTSMEGSKETPTSYEKHNIVDGRATIEEYNTTTNSGSYSVFVANRFMLEAHAQDASMDDLKAVVGAIGLGKIESLGK